MKISLIILLLALTFVQTAFAQKAGRRTVADPLPDDFLMMDTEATLDKPSLLKNFVYPDSARKNGIQGTVNVAVLIGKKGLAEKYIIEDAVHPLLDSAAARALMFAHYTSAVYNSQPIKSWMRIPIVFKIGKDRVRASVVDDSLEGDGYTRPKFDADLFYSSLNLSAKDYKPSDSWKVEVVVDSTGKALEVLNNSEIPVGIFTEIRRVFLQTIFVPATRNGRKVADRVMLVIKPLPR